MPGTNAWAKSSAEEANIKAAVIFNLIRFSSWETRQDHDTEKEILLCTQSNRILQSAIGNLRGKEIKRKTLRVKHLTLQDRNYEACQVLFFSNDIDLQKRDYDLLHSKNILTMGDHPRVLRQGASMSVQRQGKKVRFSINRQAMRDAKITPSSKILNLAAGSN